MESIESLVSFFKNRLTSVTKKLGLSALKSNAIMLISLSSAGFLSLLVSIDIARSLGVEEFGVYSMIISIQTIFSLFAGFSIGTAAGKYVSEYRVRNEVQAREFAKTGLVLLFLFSAISFCVYLMLADVIGNQLYHTPSIVGLIPLSGMVMFSTAAWSTVIGIAQGCQRIRLLAFMQVASPGLSLLTIVLLLPYFGMNGIFIGFFVSQSVVSGVAITSLNASDFPFLAHQTKILDPVVGRKLLSFAVPSVIASLIVGPVYWFGNTTLTLTNGFEALGFFAVAVVFFQSLGVLSNSITIPLVPKVSELSVGSSERVEILVSGTFKAGSSLIFPIVFGMALFSGYIVSFLYGPKYSTSREMVYLMVTASYFAILSSIVSAMIIGIGRMWVNLTLDIVWAVSFVVIALVAISPYGGAGLAVAYTGSYAIFLIAKLAVSKRVLNLDLSGVNRIVAVSGLFFLLGYIVNFYSSGSNLAINLALLLIGTIVLLGISRNLRLS